MSIASGIAGRTVEQKPRFEQLALNEIIDERWQVTGGLERERIAAQIENVPHPHPPIVIEAAHFGNLRDRPLSARHAADVDDQVECGLNLAVNRGERQLGSE